MYENKDKKAEHTKSTEIHNVYRDHTHGGKENKTWKQIKGKKKREEVKQNNI